MKYKKRMTRYHNVQVKVKNLSVSDLILQNARTTKVEQTKGKLSPKWEGPFVIKEEVRPHTYRLMFEGGEGLDQTWYSNNLAWYFQ